MTHLLRHIRSILPVLLLVGPAVAHAQEEPVSVTMVTHVPQGKKPTLTVKALTRITDVVLDLKHDETDTPILIKVAAMGAGQSKTFPLGDGAIGSAHYSGTLTVNYGKGETWSGGIMVDTVINAEIRIGYQREHLFLDKHSLEFQISRPSKNLEVDLTVYGEQGQTIGQAQQTYTDVPAGKWTAISWEPTDESTVMMMKLHASDPGGFVDETLTPWTVSIPHEDVNFATNSSVIEPGEAPKLDTAYEQITAEVAKAQKLDVRCSLFIAGHTDTVGPRDKNQKLSVDRARSIATYFRKKGLTIKVSYEGFGEDRLKVQTPDETDERANRRADYTISAEGPPQSGQVFRWKEVK